MNNWLDRQAELCHFQFLDAGFEAGQSWFADLAQRLNCSTYYARQAWLHLGLGQLFANTETKTDHWVTDLNGREFLSLPICTRQLSDTSVNVLDLVALDLVNPKKIYYRTGVQPVLGRAALSRARAISGDLILYETPLDFLKGWVSFWADYDQIVAEKPAGPETPSTDDRGLSSDQFPGVVLFDYDRPLLPIFRSVTDIQIEGDDFAQRFAKKLQREIEAEISKIKYPRVLLNKKQGVAA